MELEIVMSIGHVPESLSQAILVAIINISREIGRTWCDLSEGAMVLRSFHPTHVGTG